MVKKFRELFILLRELKKLMKAEFFLESSHLACLRKIYEILGQTKSKWLTLYVIKRYIVPYLMSVLKRSTKKILYVILVIELYKLFYKSDSDD